MHDLEHHIAVQSCRETVLRAALAADAADAQALALLFTHDAVLERPGGAPALQGRAAIEQAYATRAPQRITRHLVTQTVVDLLGPDQARATSMVLLWSGNREDPEGPWGRAADARQVVGEFHDLLHRTAQGWRIAQRRASFVLHTAA